MDARGCGRAAPAHSREWSPGVRSAAPARHWYAWIRPGFWLPAIPDRAVDRAPGLRPDRTPPPRPPARSRRRKPPADERALARKARAAHSSSSTRRVAFAAVVAD